MPRHSARFFAGQLKINAEGYGEFGLREPIRHEQLGIVLWNTAYLARVAEVLREHRQPVDACLYLFPLG